MLTFYELRIAVCLNLFINLTVFYRIFLKQCAKSQSESATAGAAGDRKPPATSSTSASSKKTSGVAVAVAVSAASIAGQALDDVHVYSNKKRNLLKGTDKDV